jgi:hypothetical protein
MHKCIQNIIGKLFTSRLLYCITNRMFDKAVFNFIKMKEWPSKIMTLLFSNLCFNVAALDSEPKGLYLSLPCLAYMELAIFDCTIRKKIL